jgi:hypothetical protein
VKVAETPACRCRDYRSRKGRHGDWSGQHHAQGRLSAALAAWPDQALKRSRGTIISAALA